MRNTYTHTHILDWTYGYDRDSTDLALSYMEPRGARGIVCYVCTCMYVCRVHVHVHVYTHFLPLSFTCTLALSDTKTKTKTVHMHARMHAARKKRKGEITQNLGPSAARTPT